MSEQCRRYTASAFLWGKEMANGGQGTKNGGGGRGVNRASKKSSAADIGQLQALAQKSGAAADQQLADQIDEIIRSTIITEKDQDPGDTQKFFNAIGYTSNKPVTVKSEMDLENEINAGNQSSDYQYYIFHGDVASNAAEGKAFASQLHGRRDQYISSGRLGDGTYFSTSPLGSANYMDRNGYGRQTKAILNQNAKVISESKLTRMITKFQKSHPKAYASIRKMQGSKGNYWGKEAKYGVFASLFGYNVVTDGSGGKQHDHYLAVFDRSALTMVTGKTMGRSDIRQAFMNNSSAWQYKNAHED